MVRGGAPDMWYLEGFLDGGDRLWRTHLRTTPFVVGRGPGCDLVVGSDGVSFQHAELQLRGDSGLWLIDRGSRNGTFLNGRRLAAEQRLEEGDLLRFADQEFRLGRLRPSPLVGGQTLSLSSEDFEPRLLGRSRELEEMLRRRAVLAHFQPLVRLASGEVFGFEHLGRGILGEQLTGPGELFLIAEAMGLEQRLNDALRQACFEQAHLLPPGMRVFVNTHPKEVGNVDAFVRSLVRVRETAPEVDVVVEIHETAVTDVAVFRYLRQALDEVGIDIAFDDFGTGQARLVELAEATPRYLKFDVLWLSGETSGRRWALLERLLGLARDLGIETLLEGVETAAQADKARAFGFDYGQGYHFGRPAPAETFS